MPPLPNGFESNVVRCEAHGPNLLCLMGFIWFYDWKLCFDTHVSSQEKELQCVTCFSVGWRPSLSLTFEGAKWMPLHLYARPRVEDLDITKAPHVQGNGPNDQNYIRSFHWLFDKTPSAQVIDCPMSLQITAPCKLSEAAVTAFASLLSFTVLGF